MKISKPQDYYWKAATELSRKSARTSRFIDSGNLKLPSGKPIKNIDLACSSVQPGLKISDYLSIMT